VIHAGIYYEPGSLKARLCVEGRQRLYQYLTERELPHRRCGKLIVAIEDAEIPQLEALFTRSLANGVEEMEWLDGAQAHSLEPSVRAVAALHSGTTGIVDAHAFMDSLAVDARNSGADLVFHAEVVGAERTAEGWTIAVRGTDGEVDVLEAVAVINAAGLYADEIAALVIPKDAMDPLRLNWVKGSYYSISPSSAVRASRLIYPCPHPDLKGLGVHLTLDLGGGQRLGPDVEPLQDRTEDYRMDEERGTAFAEAARRFLPDIKPEDLAPAYSGLRPQRQVKAGFRDFYIAEETGNGAPAWINLIGIESPGLTCALAIGEHVAGLVAHT
jgi:L-2-hydroxyglutarate oxidase LhgO